MTQTPASPARFDVLAVGNAIVDVLAPCEPAFLAAQGLTAGSMQLVDEVQSAALYDAMAAGVEASGGSAGNTVAGVGSFGGKGGPQRVAQPRLRRPQQRRQFDAACAQQVPALRQQWA